MFKPAALFVGACLAASGTAASPFGVRNLLGTKPECPAATSPSSEVCKNDCFKAEVVNGKTVIKNCFPKTISFIAVDPGCTGTCPTKYEEVAAGAVIYELPKDKCDAKVCIYVHDGTLKHTDRVTAPESCYSSPNQLCALCPYGPVVVHNPCAADDACHKDCKCTEGKGCECSQIVCDPGPCEEGPCTCDAHTGACKCEPKPCAPGPCEKEPCTCNAMDGCKCEPKPCKPGPCEQEPCKCDEHGCKCEPKPCKPGPCEQEPCTCDDKGCKCTPKPCKPGPCEQEPCKCDEHGCKCEPKPCKPGVCEATPCTCDAKTGCKCPPKDCDDHDKCTKDTCEHNTCKHTPITTGDCAPHPPPCKHEGDSCGPGYECCPGYICGPHKTCVPCPEGHVCGTCPNTSKKGNLKYCVEDLESINSSTGKAGQATCGKVTCQALCEIACGTDGSVTYAANKCDNSGGGNCQGVLADGPDNSTEEPSLANFKGGPCCGCNVDKACPARG